MTPLNIQMEAENAVRHVEQLDQCGRPSEGMGLVLLARSYYMFSSCKFSPSISPNH